MKFVDTIFFSVLFLSSQSTTVVMSQGDPDCDVNSNASVFVSDASYLLQSAVDGDHGYGMIFRDRYDMEVPCSWMDPYNVDAGLCYDDSGGEKYCNTEGVCGVAATYLHNDISVPNQVYMLTGTYQ